MSKEIEDKVLEIVNAEISNEFKGYLIVTMDSSIDSLGFLQIDKLDLIMELEQEFIIEIDDDDIEGIKTVQDVVDIVKSLVVAS